jgi:hypothetical protein
MVADPSTTSAVSQNGQTSSRSVPWTVTAAPHWVQLTCTR